MRHLFVPVLAALTCALAAPAHALPLGRAWTPTERLVPPGFEYVASPRLDIDENGVPRMVGAAINLSTGDDGVGFAWRESTWVVAWQLGADPLFFWPVVSPPWTYFLIWGGGGPQNNGYLFMTEVLGDRVTAADTVASMQPYSVGYAATVSPTRRRWVGLADYGKPRLLYSDSAGSWHEIGAVQGLPRYGLDVAALDDTTVIMMMAGGFSGPTRGLHWGTSGGTAWMPGGNLPQYDVGAGWPRFRPRPSGGLWLAWASGEPYVGIATYRDGSWSAPESLDCVHQDAVAPQYSEIPDLSRDPGEYPAVAWSTTSGSTGEETICACVPTDSGWSRAEELAGSHGGLFPTVARDLNGDVWVAWWGYRAVGGGAFWTHTYTAATSSTPVVTGAARRRVVSWTLSEPAPETWWAVLRSRTGAPFESVARVRAGPGLAMSWTDTSPPGALRYKIRRECVDTRYVRESAEVSWPRLAQATPIAIGVKNPARDAVEIRLTGAAAGRLDLELYDLQGRLVVRTQRQASGTGDDTLTLELQSLPARVSPGVYFLRVVDAQGRPSNIARLVVLP